MANEITHTITLTQTNNGTTVTMSRTRQLSLNTGVTGKFHDVQTIGISAEALNVPADYAISLISVSNLDATNFITWGFTNPPTEMVLFPGDSASIRPADNTAPVIYCKADTASCDLDIVITGDDA